ncbi:unnamed protein product [Peronospora farinosa]|uniref:WRKY19-like zinc finger domain-containing protein n=1 Tax=Peronospora farinosa TaxID=134698 RepID=A0ABN8C4F0_9STRA|nr:unnamed protein product [Peronospora farinosa]
MITKSQLDFILNPMETPQHEPLTDTLLSKSPIWTSISPNSVSGWNEEHALLYYPHTSNLHHRCDTHQLPSPVMSLPCQLVLPSIFTRSATVSSPINVSTAMNFEKEKSYLDSPKKFLSFLSHKKRTRKCNEKGCPSLVVSRRRCASGCNSKAKRYGYCWSHGGGLICSAEGCLKVAAQGGSCWAHGGGNRCKLESCSKRSYQKYGYYCKAHACYNV